MDTTILVGGVSHESNTFSTEPTTRADFQSFQEFWGTELREQLSGTNTEIGGIIEGVSDLDVDVRYTVWAAATPGGPVTTAAYERYRDEIVSTARELSDDVDGVLLPLHGAMVTEDLLDGEGALIADVRSVVGETVPIIATLDLHANVSPAMVSAADGLVAFETYPHVDMGATGRRGLELLVEAIRGNVDPVTHVERPPVLAYGPNQNTDDQPMAEIMATAREFETKDDILRVNVCPGFHAADVPFMGFSVTVVADGEQATAERVARSVGTDVWDHRSEFVSEYPDPESAVRQARELCETEQSGPVVLADTGDNPGGGGAADGTTVIREVLAQDLGDVAVAIVRDPESVAACLDAGIKGETELTIGGKTDDRHGEPIEDVAGYVKAISDGHYTNQGEMGTGSVNDLGRTVHFRCGDGRRVGIILTEKRIQPYDSEVFRHIGIAPERLDALVVKSTNHYRADYEPFASHIIPVDSPGLAAFNPARFEFEHIQRPQYPLDDLDDGAYPTER